MSLPYIIGLTGVAGSGKDTVANYLVKHRGFTKMALADPIKELLNQRFGWTMGMWEDREWKERPCVGTVGELAAISPRQLAQWLGTEVGRTIGGPNVWIHRLFERWDKTSHLVIPDVRFENEVQFIRNHAPPSAWTPRIYEVRRPSLTPIPSSSHISEAGLPRSYIYDTIVNQGDLSDFTASLEDIF